jgi:drug/metabolite transporter (DMT)-like permease
MDEQEHNAKDRLTHPAVVFGVALICGGLWGSAFPMIKIGYRFLAIAGGDAPSQILFAGMRFTLAGLMTVAILSARRGRWLAPRRKAWPKVFTLCLFQTFAQYTFFYIGLAHTSGVRGAIINATNTFWTIVLACLVFHQERLTWRKLLGTAIGFSGVVLINLAGGARAAGRFTLLGDGLIVLTAMSSAVSSVLIKSFSQSENPMMLSGWQFLTGGLLMTAVGLILGGQLPRFTLPGLGVLVYLAALSATAYSLWALLLAHNPVSRVSVYGFMNPIAGVLLSALLLGEGRQAFGWASLAALALVSAGILVVNRHGEASAAHHPGEAMAPSHQRL